LVFGLEIKSLGLENYGGLGLDNKVLFRPTSLQVSNEYKRELQNW